MNKFIVCTMHQLNYEGGEGSKTLPLKIRKPFEALAMCKGESLVYISSKFIALLDGLLVGLKKLNIKLITFLVSFNICMFGNLAINFLDGGTAGSGVSSVSLALAIHFLAVYFKSIG